jgi:hypothetical protein
MRVWIVSILLLIASFAHADLTVENVEAGAEFRYPLVSFRGKCGSNDVEASLEGAKPAKFKSARGQYVALVELKPGKNMVVLKSGRDSVKIKVSYKPMTTEYRVKAVWFGAIDEPLDYVSHQPDKPQQRDEKIDLALKLIQTATAEAMVEAGYGPKTFALDTDEDGKVKVHVVRSPKKAEELRAMDPNAVWSHAYELFRKEFGEAKFKWAGLSAFSRFDPETKKLRGHIALGGGALALFGSGTITYWPSNLGEFMSVFEDATVLDAQATFEDSNNRKTIWANVATALGAWWHELGHTLGLPHSKDPYSLMSRGFDFFNRNFSIIEPPAAGRAFAEPFEAKEHTRLDKSYAARWNWHPFLQADGPPKAYGPTPKISVEGDSVTVEAEGGIRVVCGERDDADGFLQEHVGEAPPKKLILSLKQIKEEMKTSKPVRIIVSDSFGRETRWEEKGS